MVATVVSNTMLSNELFGFILLSNGELVAIVRSMFDK